MADEFGNDLQQNIDIKFSTNAEEVSAEVGKLTDQTENLSEKQVKAAGSNKKMTESLSENTDKVTKNGGAMAILNAITGGYAQIVKDAWEALELFSVKKDVDTASTVANTTATVSSNTATQSAILAKIKDTAVMVTSTAAKYAGIAATYAITAAQWLWNTAVLANPLVAFVVAIVATIAAIYKLTTFLINNSKANEAAAAATAKATKEFEKQSEAAAKSSEALKTHNDQMYKLAQASGASAEELRKLRVKHAEEEIALKKKNTELARSTLLRQLDTLEALKNAGASDEVIENQKKLTDKMREDFKKQNDDLKESYKAKAQIIRDNQVEVVKEQTEARKEEIKRQQEHAKKLAEDAKKAAEDERNRRKQLLDNIRNLEESYLKGIQDLNDKTEEEKLARQKQRDLSEIERLRKQGGDVAELIRLNEEKYAILEKELSDKREQERKDLEQKRIDDRRAFDEQYYTGIREFSDAQNAQEIESVRAHKEALLQIERETALRKVELDGGTPEEVAEKKRQLNEFYNQKEIENTQAANDAILAQKKALNEQIGALTQSGFDTAKMLFEKNKGVQKGILIAENAVALAKVGIDTAAAVTKSVAASPLTGGQPFAGIAIATGALSAVNIIASTAKGLKALGGGGSAGSAPSGQSAPQGATPQVSFQASSENQIANTITGAQQEQKPVQAFVVSAEVTNSQQIDRNRIEGNSF